MKDQTVNKVMAERVAALQKQGYEVKILTANPNDAEVWEIGQPPGQ